MSDNKSKPGTRMDKDEMLSLFAYLKRNTESLFKSVGKIVPTFVVVAEDDRLLIIPAEFSNSDEKASAVKLVRAVAASVCARAVGIISEVYMSTVETASGMTLETFLKKNLTKKEAVQIVLFAANKLSYSGSTYIERVVPGDESTPGTLQATWNEGFLQDPHGLFPDNLSPDTFTSSVPTAPDDVTKDTGLLESLRKKVSQLFSSEPAVKEKETSTTPVEPKADLLKELIDLQGKVQGLKGISFPQAPTFDTFKN